MPDNWQSVEIKHLRALRAVADTGTFWAAAEQLNSSLSTVSDHVGALEALVGQRLIERSRGRRTVSLTEAGRVLLGHAEAIESRLRAAEADFRAYASGRSGSLRVGIYQSVANKVLPEVMRRFKRRWPDVDVQLSEATDDNDLIDAVERGDLDLTFAIQPIPAGPFEVRELMRDPYVLVTPAGSAMASHRPRIGDLAGLPMIGFQHGKHQDLAEDFLLGRGVGRDARVDLRFALVEGPPDQCARGLFGEASPAKRREDRVADLGAADRLGRTVKAAVPDHHLGVRDHEARRPVAAIGVFLHA